MNNRIPSQLPLPPPPNALRSSVIPTYGPYIHPSPTVTIPYPTTTLVRSFYSTHPPPPQPIIHSHPQYPMYQRPMPQIINTHNNNDNNRYRAASNQQNSHITNDVIQIGDFCIDKLANSTSHCQATPHYKNCFNCGGGHMIRDCKHQRDAQCVRFNRHLKELYDSSLNNGNANGKKKRQRFVNQRYYENISQKSTQQKNKQNGNKNEKNKNEREQGQIYENESKEDTESQSENETKIGFKFDSEIECLNVFRTDDDIKQFEIEYKAELENDKKQIAANQNRKRNKYERTQTQKQKQKSYKQHPNDIDHRTRDRDRNNHRSRDRRSERDRDYDFDYDRSRSRRRDRSMSRNRRRDRSHLNEQYVEERIDYGLKKKVQKINNFIDDKYSPQRKKNGNNRREKHHKNDRRDRDKRHRR